MSNDPQSHLVIDLAYAMVAQVAPDELPMFPATSTAYRQNPQQILSGAAETDEMLGFGAGEAVAFLTPIVFLLSSEVITFITQEVLTSVKQESSGLLSSLVKKFFSWLHREKQPASTQSLPPLTVEQQERVHAFILEKARELSLPNEQGTLLADAVIGKLALAAA